MRTRPKNLHFYRGQWRARIVVPEELRPLIGKTQLEEALGTDPKQAEKRSHAVLAAFHDKLDLARAHLEASRPTLATAAKAMFKRELEYDLLERAVPDCGVIPGAQQFYADRLRLVAAGIVTGDEAEALIGYAADDLIEKGLAATTDRTELLKALASVRIDSIAVTQSRDRGEAYPPDPRAAPLLEPDPAPLRAISNSKDVKASGLTLDQLLAKFHEERKDAAPKTKKEHEVAIRLLSGFLGKGVAITGITRADIIRYKDTLKDMPANGQQRFPGMTIVQAIKANAKLSKPYAVLNPATINGKWLMHLNNIFNWAARNDLIKDNPAKGIQIDVGKGFKEPTRVAFSNDDLKAIFSNKFFTQADTFEDRHWAILLALYTGARSSSEIQRIKLTDVYEEQGIPVIHLMQASKNVQSKRIVPLHRDLLELGFMARVKVLRNAGEVKLLPTWEPEGKINRWFLRTYKAECGIDDSRKVFHSFRHSLKTALARYGVNRDVSDLITGHKDQSVGGTYIGDQAVTMIQSMTDGLNRVDFGVKGYFAR